MSSFTIYVDGASRGNPGLAGAGAIFFDEKGEVVATISKFLGKVTNNQAEYSALVFALEKAIELKATSVMIFADSELMVRQMKGEYKIKNEGLLPLFKKARELMKQINSVQMQHVMREKNKDADRLANLAIDEATI